MRLEVIDVTGFGCLQSCRLELDGCTANLVLAPNEAGKSTMLAAIECALYGFAARNTGEGKETRERFRPWTGGSSRIHLRLRGPRNVWEVDFEILGADGEPIERVTVRRDGTDVTDEMSGAATSPGAWLLGLSQSDFRQSVLVRQGELEAVKDDLGQLVHRLEQVVTSSAEGGASATEAMARLQASLDDYRAAAGLEHHSSDLLARAKQWGKVEPRLDEAVRSLHAERAALEQRRDALAAQIARLDHDDALAARLEEAARLLGALEQHAQLRQLREQLGREQRLAETLRALDEEIASLDDVAAFSADGAALPPLLEREAQQRQQMEQLAARAAGARSDLEGARRELERLAAVQPLIAAGDELRDGLVLLREAAGRCEGADAELAAATQELADRGVPIERLQAARALRDRLDDGQRALVDRFDQRRTELEQAQRSAEAEAARTNHDARQIERRRRVRVIAGGAALLGGPLIGALLGVLLAPALGMGTAAVIAVAVAGAGFAVGAWLLLRGRGADRAARHQAQDAASRAQALASDARRAIDDLHGSLHTAAAGLNVEPAELIEASVLCAAHADRLGRHDHLARRRQEAAQQLAALREQWRAWGRSAGELQDDAAVSVETAEALLRRVRRAADLHEVVEGAVARLRDGEEAAGQARARLLETQRAIGAVLAAGEIALPEDASRQPLAADLVAGAAARFRERAERAHRRAALLHERTMRSGQALDPAERGRIEQRAEALEAALASHDADLADAGAAFERLRGLGACDDLGDDVAGWRLDALAPEIVSQAGNQVKQRAIELRRRLADSGRETRSFLHELGTRLPALEREEAHLAAELQRGREFAAAVELAKQTLDAVQSKTYELWQRPMDTELRRLVKALLPEYALDLVHRNLSVVLIHEPTGQRLTIEHVSRHFSRGAKDRFFLAMRLALAGTLGSDRELPLPLLLDDPLANCDDDRFAAGMRLFGELAASGVPLLIFCCQESRCRAALHEHPALREQFTLLPCAGALAEA